MKHYFGLYLFVKAYRITHREIWVSVKLLLLVTMVAVMTEALRLP